MAYSSMRPSDMTTPYEALQANNVIFGAPDRRQGNRVITILVRYSI